MTELVVVADEGPVRLVRMNRPEKKNALNSPMYDAMAAAIEGANKAANIRCVMLAGAPGAFCAGSDLQEFQRAAAEGAGLRVPVIRFLHALARVEKPLIAAV